MISNKLYDKPCKEIFRLKRMLEKEKIPFEFIKGFGYDKEISKSDFPDLLEHYHICYPKKGAGMRISVIEGFGTYGREQDRLELLGGFTPYEKFHYGNSPIGFLRAENVFKRIKKDWEENKKKGEG